MKRLGGVSVADAVEFYVRRHEGLTAARLVTEVAEKLLASKRADKPSLR